jgi:hypothetical protein
MRLRPSHGWWFSLAAALPCLVLLAFAGIGLHEWWLIVTNQIAVVPMPKAGDAVAVEVPASRVLPLVLGSGALAAAFGYALLRGSRKVLGGAYAALALVIGAAAARHLS